MNVCASFFRDINLEPFAVQPCCDVHGVDVPRFPFDGGRLDIRAYGAHIANMLRRLQDNDDTLCRGCPKLREVPDVTATARLLFQSVSINMHRYLCNCRCVYCNYWKSKGRFYPVLPVLQSLHEQHAVSPDCFFSWGGGEPSILQDFDEANAWIMEHNFNQYVHTNCLRFSPSIATMLCKGAGEINVSLDSGTPQIYKKVKGVDGFFKVCENLKHYREKALSSDAIHLKYIIFEMNNRISEVNKFFEICRETGISHVEYSFDFRELNGKGPSSESLLAAAFFQARAEELKMACRPFFIPEKWLKRINAVARRYV